MNLTATQHKVIKVNFRPIPKSNNEDYFNLDYSPKFYTKDKKIFSIFFDVSLKTKNEYSVDIKYETIFKTSEEIDDEFKNSHFPYVNTPAIGFPFLRAFVSFMTLNAGYKPLILPSINFVNYYQEKIDIQH